MATLKIPAKRSRVKPRPADFGDPLEGPKPKAKPKKRPKPRGIPGTRDNMEIRDPRRLIPRKERKA